MYDTTYHRDGTVTTWDAGEQSWLRRASSIPDRVLASMSEDERERVLRHVGGVTGEPCDNPAVALRRHLGHDARERCGEDPTPWSRYEAGKVEPSADRVRAWCRAAGVAMTVDEDGWRVV